MGDDEWMDTVGECRQPYSGNKVRLQGRALLQSVQLLTSETCRAVRGAEDRPTANDDSSCLIEGAWPTFYVQAEVDTQQ